jgi:hypothetical protein
MILTIVALPSQAYGDDDGARQLFEDVAPRFQAIPGLHTKYFVSGPHSGGVYIWEDRAAAEGYLNAAWSERMTKSYGAAPQVTYLDVPCVVDNTAGEIQFPG